MVTKEELLQQIEEAKNAEAAAEKANAKLNECIYPIKNDLGDVMFESKQDLIDACKSFWQSPEGLAAQRRAIQGKGVIECLRESRAKQKEDDKCISKGEA